MQNIDVVERKLHDYIEEFIGTWDEQCEQSLIESSEFAFSNLTGEYDTDCCTSMTEGVMLGILLVMTRNDPRFRQWANEVLMGVLPADECAVMVEG